MYEALEYNFFFAQPPTHTCVVLVTQREQRRDECRMLQRNPTLRTRKSLYREHPPEDTKRREHVVTHGLKSTLTKYSKSRQSHTCNNINYFIQREIERESRCAAAEEDTDTAKSGKREGEGKQMGSNLKFAGRLRA